MIEYFYTIFLLLVGTVLFGQSKILTVNYVIKDARDGEIVVLQGTIGTQVDFDEFIFQDKTGSIKVKIFEKNTQITPDIKNRIFELENSTVKLRALVKKKYLKNGRVVLEATNIKILKPSKDDF